MHRLLVGFDSAWTRGRTGAIVGVLIDDACGVRVLGLPRLVQYADASEVICSWQQDHAPSSTLILLDQPTIVANDTGQRPVERLLCSAVSRRRGGIQPAHRGRSEMFGTAAPLWEFLSRFGGAADPFGVTTATRVIETYPVLAIISLGWTLPDSERAAGRLPKYNPERRSTFKLEDWIHVCRQAETDLRTAGATELAVWCGQAADIRKPRKDDQDRLDACICLIVALHLATGGDCLFAGDCATGYIAVPDSVHLRDELATRCRELGMLPTECLRVLRLNTASARVQEGEAEAQ